MGFGYARTPREFFRYGEANLDKHTLHMARRITLKIAELQFC
jgi:hypothetical protein